MTRASALEVVGADWLVCNVTVILLIVGHVLQRSAPVVRLSG
jgi:hypothetical protein